MVALFLSSFVAVNKILVVVVVILFMLSANSSIDDADGQWG